jgi:hypothetical protein
MVIGYWSLDTRCSILDTGYWLLDTGYWSLVTCHWSLVTGHSIFLYNLNPGQSSVNFPKFELLVQYRVSSIEHQEAGNQLQLFSL